MSSTYAQFNGLIVSYPPFFVSRFLLCNKKLIVFKIDNSFLKMNMYIEPQRDGELC